MRYAGGKYRIAKRIIEVMSKYREPGQTWVEPFVGGANVLFRVSGPRIGSDSNEYIIAMWQALQNGWTPPQRVTRELYYDIKDSPELYDPAFVGFASVGCSFAGKWFDSFAKVDNPDDDGAGMDLVTLRAVLKQVKTMPTTEVLFFKHPYNKLPLPANSFIYCDPPYADTTNGYRSRYFDSNLFFEWCREKTREGHTVFISERKAPADFTKIFEIQRITSMNRKKTRKDYEKLFTYLPENIRDLF